MALLFSDIINLNELCGPCADPAAPTGALYWEKSSDAGVTWVQTVLPDSTDLANLDGDLWRYVCPDGTSNVVEIVDCDDLNSYVSQTINIDLGVNEFYEVCFPCCSPNQAWQFRIDDAEADIDHADGPNLVTGDRPDSDPGNPTPDQAWQTINLAGENCVVFSVEEIWPDAVDPDGPAQLGEFFVFYLRTACDGVSWQPEITVTLQT